MEPCRRTLVDTDTFVIPQFWEARDRSVWWDLRYLHVWLTGTFSEQLKFKIGTRTNSPSWSREQGFNCVPLLKASVGALQTQLPLLHFSGTAQTAAGAAPRGMHASLESGP